MGWSSGTEIFDVVVGALIEDNPKEEIISRLIDIMEDHDWDGHSESDYIRHPLVRKIFEEKDPSMKEWYEEMDNNQY